MSRTISWNSFFVVTIALLYAMSAGASAAVSAIVKRNQNQREGFDENRRRTPLEWVFHILMYIAGAFGAYLSWTCNTAQGYNVFAKIFFAFFAFAFGVFYLLAYALLRRPCKVKPRNANGFSTSKV